MKNRICWLDTDPWRTNVGFTTSPAAYRREIRRLLGNDQTYFAEYHGVPDRPANASVTPLKDQSGATVCLVFLNREQRKDRTGIEIVATIAHECMHVWQFIKEFHGVHDPDKESEAYAFDNLLVKLLTAYMDGY